MASLKSSFLQAIDDLPNKELEDAVYDFLNEQILVGEFLAWLEKWKTLHTTK